MKYLIIIFIILYFLLNNKKYKNFNNKNLKKKYIVKEYPVKYEILNNFLNKKDINHIIENCKNYLGNSTVVNDNQTINDWRTSKTAFINDILGNNDEVLKKIIKKVKKKLKVESEYIEDINLTYYKKGDKYKIHHDYFNPNFSQAERDILKKVVKECMHYFCLFKNAIKGGETNFPIFNKKFKLNEGDAILWQNAYFENEFAI